MTISTLTVNIGDGGNYIMSCGDARSNVECYECGCRHDCMCEDLDPEYRTKAWRDYWKAKKEERKNEKSN